MSALVDPWDNFEPADFPPGPVRVIPITAEIRAEEAAKQAAREIPSSDWKIKATLSEANLRGVTLASLRLRAKLPKPRAQALVIKPVVHATAQPKLRRKSMRPHAIFEVLQPVATEDAPQKFILRGRHSPYVPLYAEVANTPPGKHLPITVDDRAAGYAVTQALRKLARRSGKELDMRSSADGKTFYFAVSERAEA